MPIGAALPLILGAGSAIAGGIAGATNTRPPSLDPTQQNALHNLLSSLMPNATGTPTIDPIQQALMYGNIAASRTGADTALTHALVSRGLGRSGILGEGLIQNQNTAQQAQNQTNLVLQQQAVQQKQLNIQDILGLLQVPNIPGQSGAGGFFGGVAPMLAFMMALNGGMNKATPYSGPGAGTVGAPTPVLPLTGPLANTSLPLSTWNG